MAIKFSGIFHYTGLDSNALQDYNIGIENRKKTDSKGNLRRGNPFLTAKQSIKDEAIVDTDMNFSIESAFQQLNPEVGKRFDSAIRLALNGLTSYFQLITYSGEIKNASTNEDQENPPNNYKWALSYLVHVEEPENLVKYPALGIRTQPRDEDGQPLDSYEAIEVDEVDTINDSYEIQAITPIEIGPNLASNYYYNDIESLPDIEQIVNVVVSGKEGQKLVPNTILDFHDETLKYMERHGEYEISLNPDTYSATTVFLFRPSNESNIFSAVELKTVKGKYFNLLDPNKVNTLEKQITELQTRGVVNYFPDFNSLLKIDSI